MIYTIYDAVTGRIVGHCTTSFEELPPPVESFLNIEGHYDIQTHYVDDGIIANRPTMTVSQSKQDVIADSIDSVTLMGVPLGATIRWNATEQTADGNDVEFVTDIIGEHKLQIFLWPYQDTEVIINAI